MSTRCFAPLLGKRIRVTTLDTCGNPPASATPNAFLATDGFISVSLSAEVEDGAEIIQRKADGSLCVNEKFASSFKRFTVEMEFCGVNPSLVSMVTNAKPYLDWLGNTAGFTVGEGTIVKPFALELWTGLAGAQCAPGAFAGGYLLLPYVMGGTPGDITVNGADSVTFSLKGAYTKGGNGWGVGPYQVVRGGATTNEVQTVTETGSPTGGTFKLSYKGQQTAAQPWNVTAAALQTALAGLSTIGAGNVAVTGGPGPTTPYTVTFQGLLAGTDVPLLGVASALSGGTTPGITVAATTTGSGGAPTSLPQPLDPFDHLLLMDTSVAPPPSACDPQPMP